MPQQSRCDGALGGRQSDLRVEAAPVRRNREVPEGVIERRRCSHLPGGTGS